MGAEERGHRKDDAPSDAAKRIEDKLIEETGQASGDPDKPVQEKFDELGEKPDIRKKGLRD